MPGPPIDHKKAIATDLKRLRRELDATIEAVEEDFFDVKAIVSFIERFSHVLIDMTEAKIAQKAQPEEELIDPTPPE